jgi:2-polyprenyl-3-methyl-5-hydroxy-6-metoxy-1,4-benzoquinol methylase
MKRKKQEKLSIADYFNYWRGLHKKYHSLDRRIDQKGLTVIGHEGCPLWYNKFFDYFTNLYFQQMLLLCGDIKGRRVLDVGCGGGRWCERLADKGAEVIGIDIGKEIIERNSEILATGANFCSCQLITSISLTGHSTLLFQ